LTEGKRQEDDHVPGVPLDVHVEANASALQWVRREFAPARAAGQSLAHRNTAARRCRNNRRVEALIRPNAFPDASLRWADWKRVVTRPWGAGEGWFMELFPGPFRHLASEVLSDLVTAVLVALAAVIASRLLDRIWDAL
jgi:hypothetical protein